jgi:flagellar biosynthesis protein FlhA
MPTKRGNKGAGARMMRAGIANRDIAFAAVVVLVLAMLFVPLPPVLLDLGLAISLSVSVLVLMVSLWIARPLDFNSFPTVLLVVTMLRLALNIASTRLILSEGHTGTDAAGGVIEGFSQFIVGGNFVIGAVIFLILVIINFIVITKGSTRIAEVSARFYLDSMPGKQMAIDADLGAGLINDEEARRRRKELEDESSFYGSMDGASKFVRGDAVAGLIITAINLIGGALIGILQHQMSVGDAMSVYMTLTIGDGLVSQVPALVVSLAAGLIVTKGGTVGAANEAVIRQLGGFPKALYMSAVLLFGMGLLPSFPILIFTALALVLAGLGLMVQRMEAREAERRAISAAQGGATPDMTPEEVLKEMMKVDPLRLDLGAGVVPLVEAADAALPSKIQGLRKLFGRDYGFVLPALRIRDEPTLGTDEYAIRVNGIQVAKGRISPGNVMVIMPHTDRPDLAGERGRDPTFGLEVIWVSPEDGVELERSGLTVVDAENVITTHLTEVIRENMSDFVSYAATQALIADQDRDYQKLAADLPGGAPVVLLQQVLQGLLAERVSIRNLPMILEAIAELGRPANPQLIIEHVRRRLSRQICDSLTDEAGLIPVITLSPAWEAEFAAAVRVEADGTGFLLPPKRAQEFVLAARTVIQRFAQGDSWPALLVDQEVRPHVRAMLERVSPKTPILSHAEVHRRAGIRTVGTVGS